jgi:hypothetical protein
VSAVDVVFLGASLGMLPISVAMLFGWKLLDRHTPHTSADTSDGSVVRVDR